MTKHPIIVALDTPSTPEALRLVNLLKSKVRLFKVGLTAYTAGGKGLVEAIKAMGCEVFLDLKLFDIPHQITGTVQEITNLGVKMFTIAAFGGIDMMNEAARAAHEEARRSGVARPLVIGVTVLTSLSQDSLKGLGINRAVREEAVYLSTLAKRAGLDGVVASGEEVEAIKRACGKDFLVVVPGVRPVSTARYDQKRVVGPKEAIERGADYIVIGRPITKSEDPVAAVNRIIREGNP